MNGADRSLLSFIDAPVVVGDPDGHAVYVNPAFESRFDIAADRALGRPLAELFEGGGREAVLAASEDLRTRREHVLALDGLVGACEKALGEGKTDSLFPPDNAAGAVESARPPRRGPRGSAGKVAHDRALPAPFTPPPDPPAGGLARTLWDAEQLATVLAIPMHPNSRRVLLRTTGEEDDEE